MREIKIDRDCVWYCDGAKMTRDNIVELLSRNVVADKDGNWLIKFKNQNYPVLVEDVPFLVKDIISGSSTLKLRTNDNRLVDLPTGGIEIKNGIPYTSLFNDKTDAKFTRNAFWKLSQFIKEIDGGYEIICAEKKWPVRLR